MKKETVLRFIHSQAYKGKDIIHAQSRRDSHIVFHCQFQSNEGTLLQEERELERTVSLRVRYLVNPPPQLNLEPYSSVSKLELSCPVDMSWVFYIGSFLPNLQIIRFGSSSFTDNFMFENRDSKISESKKYLSKSPQVKELVISYDHTAKLSLDQNKRLVKVMDSILDLSANFLVQLVKANLVLPLGTNIDGFLEQFPTMKSNGDKREVFKHGFVSFTSHSKNSPPTSKRGSPPEKDEKEIKKKDPTPQTKKYKSETPLYISLSEEEPCTSTTRSPRSDRSSESELPDPRLRSRMNRSPSLLEFDQMFTRR